MKTYLTIQARTGSTRFPGKIMHSLYEGMSVLEIMIKRTLSRSWETVVLTTDNVNDKPIIELCERMKVKYFKGNEEDVLSRMDDFCDDKDKDDIIIDLTSDCPLLDVFFIGEIYNRFKSKKYDYLSNVFIRNFPDGFDVQIYKVDLLRQVNKLVKEQNLRQHTGWNILNQRKNLYLRSQKGIGEYDDCSGFHHQDIDLTLDEYEDLVVLKVIFHYFDNIRFTYEDVMRYIESEPEILEINKSVKRKKPGE